MNPIAGNHPCQTFPPNQDQFPHWKSSLQNIFSKSGSIPPLEVIPARHFHQIRINSPAGNHPCKIFLSNRMNPIAGNHLCKTFLSNQDAYRCRKAFRPQKASWQSCAPQAHVSTSTNKSPVSASANKSPASASACKLRIHLCLDGKHDSRKLPDAVIVHAADGNRDGKCVP